MVYREGREERWEPADLVPENVQPPQYDRLKINLIHFVPKSFHKIECNCFSYLEVSGFIFWFNNVLVVQMHGNVLIAKYK